jgi:tetratricopeptide (TPR) repeat protein
VTPGFGPSGLARKLTDHLRRGFLGIRVCVFCAVSALAVGAVAPASAQTAVDPSVRELQSEYDAVFQQVFRNPGDLDTTFKFAELAVKLENYEAAISALERMLLINPNLPRVRLELGVLYFRLGSYQIARTYLNRAVEGPDVPQAVRERVAVFLAEIEKRLSVHTWSGTLYGGLRFQTNANAGPTSDSVRANGADATLDNEFVRKRDWNAFVSANVRHTYDFQAQNGAILDTGITVYGSEQRRQHALELVLVEVETGPRFQTDTEMLGESAWRPYVVSGIVGLQQARYLTSYGLGLEGNKAFTDRLAADVTFEQRYKHYNDSNKRATASQQNGYESSARLGIRYAKSATEMVSVTGRLANTHASTEFHSNTDAQLTAGYTLQHDAPAFLPYDVLKQRPWTTTVSGTRAVASYHGPNPSVDPNATRRDQEWRMNLLVAIPLDGTWTLIANAQRNLTSSSLPNFENTNEIFSLGAAWRF